MVAVASRHFSKSRCLITEIAWRERERERDFHLLPPEKKEGGSNTLYPA